MWTRSCLPLQPRLYFQIGVDFALKVINWDPKTVVRLQLWDIAGQERFGNMTRVYYKEAVGAFVVFDVTRVNTFEAVQKWKNDIDSKVGFFFLFMNVVSNMATTKNPSSRTMQVTLPPDDRPIPVVLLANKCDLAKEGFARNAAQMDKYCEEHGFAGWEETSAKDNINIDKAAKFLVGKILENDINRQQQQKKDENIVKVGHTPEQPKPSNGGCCG